MMGPTLSVIAGLALLVVGGELLVRGATSISTLLRVSPAVIGLTVVAMGTSMPELVVSVQAALDAKPEIALSNAVGSNIFNIAFILGLAALISPLRVAGRSVRFEWPVMVLAACQLHLLARDGQLDRLEGAALLAAMLAFLVYVVWVARHAANPEEHKQFEASQNRPLGEHGIRAWILSVAALGAGVGLLAFGGSVLVAGAAELALDLGLSARVIGLTVVAAGTSLPELVTSVIASVRGRDDIAVTNVLGSNIFNVLGILGVTALIDPLPANPVSVATDDWWMIGVSALLFPLMISNYRISRVEGGILLATFGLYIASILR